MFSTGLMRDARRFENRRCHTFGWTYGRMDVLRWIYNITDMCLYVFIFTLLFIQRKTKSNNNGIPRRCKWRIFKYAMMPIIESRPVPTVGIPAYQQYTTESVFNPGTAKAPWRGWADRVNVESSLFAIETRIRQTQQRRTHNFFAVFSTGKPLRQSTTPPVFCGGCNDSKTLLTVFRQLDVSGDVVKTLAGRIRSGN